MATIEIKIMLIQLLRNFNLNLKPGKQFRVIWKLLMQPEDLDLVDFVPI